MKKKHKHIKITNREDFMLDKILDQVKERNENYNKKGKKR